MNFLVGINHYKPPSDSENQSVTTGSRKWGETLSAAKAANAWPWRCSKAAISWAPSAWVDPNACARQSCGSHTWREPPAAAGAGQFWDHHVIHRYAYGCHVHIEIYACAMHIFPKIPNSRIHQDPPFEAYLSYKAGDLLRTWRLSRVPEANAFHRGPRCARCNRESPAVRWRTHSFSDSKAVSPAL